MLKYKCALVIERYSNIDKIDDYFEGEHNGVNFSIAEITQKIKHNKGGTSTIYKGIVVKLKLNKNFSGHTVITKDHLMHVSPDINLKHTELEDVVFEKKYDVFTTDEVEARYLITPSFMERLNNIKTTFKVNNIRCAFYHNNLFIGLKSSGDFFCLANLFKKIDDKKQYYDLVNEIYLIISLIDYFKLNEKTGL